jgi:hypothetical protein
MGELTDPNDFLSKMDWEGYQGIEWFASSSFEDTELDQLVQSAYDSWIDFKDDLEAAEARAQELVDAATDKTDEK